jgi:hypothetical protein
MFGRYSPASAANARLGRAPAIIRRGEPVQFQAGVFFERDRKPARPRRWHDAQARFRNNEEMPLICPTCQAAARAVAAAATLHGVVFDIFGGALLSREFSNRGEGAGLI